MTFIIETEIKMKRPSFVLISQETDNTENPMILILTHDDLDTELDVDMIRNKRIDYDK